MSLSFDEWYLVFLYLPAADLKSSALTCHFFHDVVVEIHATKMGAGLRCKWRYIELELLSFLTPIDSLENKFQLWSSVSSNLLGLKFEVVAKNDDTSDDDCHFFDQWIKSCNPKYIVLLLKTLNHSFKICSMLLVSVNYVEFNESEMTVIVTDPSYHHVIPLGTNFSNLKNPVYVTSSNLIPRNKPLSFFQRTQSDDKGNYWIFRYTPEGIVEYAHSLSISQMQTKQIIPIKMSKFFDKLMPFGHESVLTVFQSKVFNFRTGESSYLYHKFITSVWRESLPWPTLIVNSITSEGCQTFIRTTGHWFRIVDGRLTLELYSVPNTIETFDYCFVEQKMIYLTFK